MKTNNTPRKISHAKGPRGICCGYSEQIPGRTGGFSLIEMLASLMIIALVLTTLLTIRSNSIKEATLVKNSRTAWKLAREKYGEIKAMQNPENIPTGGTFEDHRGYRWETQVEQKVLNVSPGPNHQSFDPRKEEKRRMIYQVLLTVYFPGPGDEKEQKYEIMMYRLPPDDLKEKQDDDSSNDSGDNGNNSGGNN